MEKNEVKMMRELFAKELNRLNAHIDDSGDIIWSPYFGVYLKVDPFNSCILKAGNFSPKPGDLVTVISPRGKSIFIYKSGECKKGKKVYCFAQLHYGNGFCDGSWIIEDKNNDTTDWHLSTKSDRCEFFEAMVKAGYKWNARKLELKKVEKKWEPEDGDFVVAECPMILPFLIIARSDSTGIGHHACLHNGHLSILSTGYFSNNFKFCKQTEQEKKMLIDALSKDGKTWNPKLKRIEDMKWRAEKGEAYLYLFFEFGTACVAGASDDRSGIDDMLFSSGNYFKTKNSAQIFADKINELLKQNAK